MSYSSKLSAFCEKIIEAGWLAALIMAPLFFDVYSSRVFEPDKISLVRSVALILIAAWSLRWLDQWRLTVRSENRAPTPGFFQRLRAQVGGWQKKNPLTLPTLFLIISYLISTLASISPSVTFWGSYQRLQGTYTTFSYIVIFFLAASLIRTRAQFDRAVNLAIVVSIPIAFYGIIQHYFLDPLPWGGDVTSRVASNMGNAIFVGAFLILVVPLVIARLIEQVQRAGQEAGSRVQQLAIYFAAALSILGILAMWVFSFDSGARVLLERGGYNGTPTPELLAAATSNFNAALAVSAALVLVWWLVAFVLNRRASTFLLIGLYALTLAFQFACIIFTQSRGPQLGILGGLFAFAVLYSIARHAYRLALGSVVVAAVGLTFLVIFNTASAEPIVQLRNNQYIGRLGKVFDTNDGTNKVRSLIWQGALQLVLPHPALWSPTTGDDTLNLIRPLIGYGPEAMYVAYNSFYPPDLAHVESRNASPDRSHNETFDSLVSTGLIGFAAYIVLFLAVFYYALKWLGFIETPLQRNIFIALWLSGAFLTTLVFGFVIGWNFIGVAMPAGMIVGFLIYLVGFALLRGRHLVDANPTRTLWLIALLSIVIAHFIEINFGIAIASTRTYFWFIAAVLVALGTNRVAGMAVAAASEAANTAPTIPPLRAGEGRKGGGETPAIRKTTRRPNSPAARADAARRGNVSKPKNEVSSTPIVVWSFLCGLALATMGFDYISTTYGGQGNPLDAFVTALTMRPTTLGLAPSFAMLWLFVVTIVCAGAIGLGEWARDVRLTLRDWGIASALFVVLSLAIFSSFVLYHMLLLTADPTRIGQAILATIGMFNLFMIIMMLVIASALLFDIPLPGQFIGREWNWVFVPLFAVIAGFIISATNVEIVKADIEYKQGQNSDSLGCYDPCTQGQQTLEGSIAAYTKSLQSEPTQDFYMLFLGRAYLESAKTIQDATAREQRLQKAQDILLEAQKINPLNTDHTANLARLNSVWAQLATTPQEHEDHLQKSLAYYQETLRLSPNTAHLYNEWGQVLLEHNERQAAFEKFEKSLQLDQEFSDTPLLLGDWYRTGNDQKSAAKQYLAALQLDPNALIDQNGLPITARIDTLVSGGQADAAETVWLKAIEADATAYIPRMELAELYRLETQNDKAGAQLQSAVSLQPQNLQVLTFAANAYSEMGNYQSAITTATAAKALIPKPNTSDANRYQAFISQLQQLQNSLNAVAKNPDDVEAHRNLGFLYFIRTQYDSALSEYRQVVTLKPTDFDGWRSLGLVYVQLNQLPAARDALSQTLALAPAGGDKDIAQKLFAAVDFAVQGDKPDALTQVNVLLSQLAATDQLARSAMTALGAALQN